ncbi:transporter substrate-binding domain-containing protein ['Crotalaria aegyptiaca' phytoplasma]|uniref:Transporter substrate-binding domain-containing protein n=1 Tax=Candidatus Phytoplasma crotalariae TaxID=2982627 RepID=A0ABT9D4U4_9MOLU|nr:transporter substrate-binding domain-containing protein ['Crotalaria aegyptiaca' phytoplasma]MDO8059088.1 transporter substrate-binding domain-containing protein ['Crotalaria aegyptiaca' phytoplasma]
MLQLKIRQILKIFIFIITILFLHYKLFKIFNFTTQPSDNIILGVVSNSPPLCFDSTYSNPNSFRTDTGTYISGSDIFLFEKLAKNMNKQLKIKPLNFPGILNAVDQKIIDAAIGNMNITEERKKKMNTIEYDVSEIGFLIRKDNHKFKNYINQTKITIQDLKNLIKTHGHISATTTASSIYDIEILNKLNLHKLNPKEDLVNCVNEVEQKRVDLLIFEHPVINLMTSSKANDKNKFQSLKLINNTKNNPKKDFHYPLGIFINKQNTKLYQELTKQIDEIKKSNPNIMDNLREKAIKTYINDNHQKQQINTFENKIINIIKTYQDSFYISLTLAIDAILIGFLLALILLPFKIWCQSSKKLIKKAINYILVLCIHVTKAVPITIQVVLMYNLFIQKIFFLKDLIGIFCISLIITFLNNAFYFLNNMSRQVHFLESGPIEAAYALGLNSKQVFKHIILEQILKREIPNIWDQFIINLKETALYSIIGLPNLLWTAQRNIAITYDTITPFIIISIIYISLSSLIQILKYKKT